MCVRVLNTSIFFIYYKLIVNVKSISKQKNINNILLHTQKTRNFVLFLLKLFFVVRLNFKTNSLL